MFIWVLTWSFFSRSLPSIPLSPTKWSTDLVHAWKFRSTFLAKIRLWIWQMRRQSSNEIYLHMISFASSLRICTFEVPCNSLCCVRNSKICGIFPPSLSHLRIDSLISKHVGSFLRIPSNLFQMLPEPITQSFKHRTPPLTLLTKTWWWVNPWPFRLEIKEIYCY